MRTTVTLDEDKLLLAKELTGARTTGDVIRRALDALLAREAAHRLIRLGGTDPDAKAAPRRRSSLPPGSVATQDTSR